MSESKNAHSRHPADHRGIEWQFHTGKWNATFFHFFAGSMRNPIITSSDDSSSDTTSSKSSEYISSDNSSSDTTSSNSSATSLSSSSDSSLDESSSVDNNEEISKAADETPDKDSLPIGGVEYLEEKIEQIEEKMEVIEDKDDDGAWADQKEEALQNLSAMEQEDQEELHEKIVENELSEISGSKNTTSEFKWGDIIDPTLTMDLTSMNPPALYGSAKSNPPTMVSPAKNISATDPSSPPTMAYIESVDESLDPVANEETAENEGFEDGEAIPSGVEDGGNVEDESSSTTKTDDMYREEEEVKKVGGWLTVTSIILMIYTAYQMSENPNGICASLCRLIITVIGCMIKIALIPCKYIMGGGRPSGGHYMATPDYRDPYGSRHIELT